MIKFTKAELGFLRVFVRHHMKSKQEEGMLKNCPHFVFCSHLLEKIITHFQEKE